MEERNDSLSSTAGINPRKLEEIDKEAENFAEGGEPKVINLLQENGNESKTNIFQRHIYSLIPNYPEIMEMRSVFNLLEVKDIDPQLAPPMPLAQLALIRARAAWRKEHPGVSSSSDPDNIFDEADEAAGVATPPSNKAIAKLATDMTIANDWCKTAKAALTARLVEVDAMKLQLFEWLIASGHAKGWKFDNGINLVPVEKESVFKAGNVDNGVMIDWLNANGLGDIVKETVHFSTLSATMLSYRETLSNGQLPEIFNLQVKKTVHFRGNGAVQFLKKYHEDGEFVGEQE